jgi:ribosomal protein S12 methylthiotransferase
LPKLAVVSLGCAKNLVDTEIILGQLVKGGWQVTDNFTEAELILVNTCGFLDSAKQESIQQIMEMAEYKKPGKGVCQQFIVSGCLVQRYAKELKKAIPEVDYWVGLGEIGAITRILQNPSLKSEVLETSPPFLNNENLPRYQVTANHTSYVKIAEGCNHCCSYCAIPLIKGGFRSRSADSIVKEIIQLVQSGVKEINLIAQDITMYGWDLAPAVNLPFLLKRIISEANPPWIRLMYAYPTGIDEDLLNLIATEPSICRYLDLPLQHINSRILKMMNRPHAAENLRLQIGKIRKIVPEIVLRTTFIVGFPSESQADFLELLSFVEEGHFQHVGVFPYSREEGTPAFCYRPRSREETKLRRQELLMEAQQKISADFLLRQVNREQLILIDQVLPEGGAIGRTQAFAPEIDGVVYLDQYRGKPGQFTKGLIVSSGKYDLKAKEIF